MAKLRQIMTESKFLKREFGEPLPTFNGVMKKHKINKLKEDWWDDLGPAGQAQYLKDNPGSKKAQDAEKDDSDMGDTAADPFSRDYDADKHGESPHDKYDDNWGDEFDDDPDESVNEGMWAVKFELGDGSDATVILDASGKSAAKTAVAKRLKKGLKAILGVKRVMPNIGKKVTA